MSYDSFDLILIQTLEKALMDCECSSLAGPTEYERVRSRVRRDREPGYGNTGLRGELAYFRFKPTIFAGSQVVQMTRGSDNHWTYQILKQYYEESSYKTEH